MYHVLMSTIQLIKDVIKLFYAKKEEKVIVEIPISEELKELIKRNFNVKYDGYKIFRFNYFLENIYCFLLKNSNIKSIDTEDKKCKPIDLSKTGVRTEYVYVKSDKIELTQRQLIELLIKYKIPVAQQTVDAIQQYSVFTL